MDRQQASLKSQIDSKINDAKSILITTHMNSDPDAVCSALSFSKYIKSLGGHPDIIISGNKTKFPVDLIPGLDEITYTTDITKKINKYDLLVFLDGSEYHRFSKNPQGFNNYEGTIVCIDHHKTISEDRFDIMYRDINASATCHIIADIFFDGGKSCNKETALLLCTGIMGDTGSLRFIRPNNAAVLRIVEQLVLSGDLDLEGIYNSIASFPLGALPLYKIMVDRTTVSKIAGLPDLTYTYVTKEDNRKYYNNVSDLYHMSISRMIQGSPWCMIVRPVDEKRFRISLRSMDGGPNVRKIAETMFGGGGHDHAAGGFFETEKNLSVEDICLEIINMFSNSNSEIEIL